jgi:hypothetical protein
MPMITSGSRNEPKNEQQAAGLNQSSCSIRGNCARVGRNELHYQAGRAVFGILRQVYGGGAVAFTPAFFARLIDFDGVILEALVVARHLVPSTQSSIFAGRGRSVTSLVIC